VTAALADLALELELSGWAPWHLLERGTEWILEPKSELVALLSGDRRLPVKEAKILSEEHKAVLLGHNRVPPKRRGLQNQGGGDTGTRCLFNPGRSPEPGVDLLRPIQGIEFWRPTPSALLALGLRSHTDIPALKELEEWFRLAERNGSGSETGSFL
jgi:hypothetical protein